MRWFSETAVRIGPLNYLVGSHQSPAGRLGEQIGNRLSATAPQSVPTVAATERLAARLRAGGAEKVTVSAALHSGYLDLELFDTDSQQTAEGLQESIGSLDGPVVLHSTAGWDVLLPIPAGAGDQVLTIPLTAVPVAELGGLLDTIATAQPASVRLGFTAHQMVALATGSPHALLTAETTRFDLTVTAGTGIEVIAQLVGRRPRLHRLDVHLDAGMITVAKASLLATIAARVEELSLYWDPADDDLVRSTIVPQISLAYRDNPAFHRWTVELERQLLLPFDILAVRAPVEAATAIVAASIQDIPAELIGTEMVIYAPATGTDVGQRDVRFEGSALHDATAMQVGAHRLQLLPYAAARPVGTDPVVRHLGTSATTWKRSAPTPTALVTSECGRPLPPNWRTTHASFTRTAESSAAGALLRCRGRADHPAVAGEVPSVRTRLRRWVMARRLRHRPAVATQVRPRDHGERLPGCRPGSGGRRAGDVRCRADRVAAWVVGRRQAGPSWPRSVTSEGFSRSQIGWPHWSSRFRTVQIGTVPSRPPLSWPGPRPPTAHDCCWNWRPDHVDHQ